MSVIKIAYGPATNLNVTTITGGFGSSPTTGWQSDGFDNSSNLYIDAFFQAKIQTPAGTNSATSSFYFYVFDITDSTTNDYSTTGDGLPNGIQGALTFPNTNNIYTSSHIIGIMGGYESRILVSPPYSIAAAFHNGKLPAKFSIGMINNIGFSVNNGATVVFKIVPIYYTVF